MAEQLDSFTFKRGGPRGGSKYDAVLDGAIYLLTCGIDIPDDYVSARAILYNVAARRGHKVRIQRVDGGLVVQAYTPEAE